MMITGKVDESATSCSTSCLRLGAPNGGKEAGSGSGCASRLRYAERHRLLQLHPCVRRWIATDDGKLQFCQLRVHIRQGRSEHSILFKDVGSKWSGRVRGSRLSWPCELGTKGCLSIHSQSLTAAWPRQPRKRRVQSLCHLATNRQGEARLWTQKPNGM